MAGKRITTEGVLVIDSRKHRTQAMNRARPRARIFIALVERRRTVPKSPAPPHAARQRSAGAAHGEEKKREQCEDGGRAASAAPSRNNSVDNLRIIRALTTSRHRAG